MKNHKLDKKGDLGLEKALCWLFLNTSHMPNIGLVNGKMGSVIFFFLYSSYSNDKLCEDFASEILSELIEDIHVDIQYSFENGLLGIAWGIQFLIYKGYIDGDVKEILSDIESVIMRTDPLRVKDASLEYGIQGWNEYLALCQLNAYVPFDARYRHSILEMNEMLNLNVKCQDPIYLLDSLSLSKFEFLRLEDILLENLKFGLKDGYVGFGLKYILNAKSDFVN